MYVEMYGPKVRELREAAGVAALVLAERAAISPKTLRKVEGNRGAVRLKTARRIAAALDVARPQDLGRPA